jgi:hypothetical protein
MINLTILLNIKKQKCLMSLLDGYYQTKRQIIMCIVPVHSQQRGRIFLPFADDDPKTAEVMAKVLLLARDQEIKDPVILEQIVRIG